MEESFFRNVASPSRSAFGALALEVGGSESALSIWTTRGVVVHQDRFNQGADIGLAGVMGAELRPLAGVQTALEERCP